MNGNPGSNKITTKFCPQCWQRKSIDDFYESMQTVDGLYCYCKLCNNFNSKKQYLSKKYGITKEQYDQMVAKQEGKCLICEKIPKNNNHHNRLHIDHDHKTGKIRGLICRQCNVAIGLLQDNVNIAIRLVEYLFERK